MRYTIFGESHGPAIGVTLEGAPAGLALDWDFIRSELKRRAPGQDDTSTPRREADEVEVLSGVFEGRTTGTPLCAVIPTPTPGAGITASSGTCPGRATPTTPDSSATGDTTTTGAGDISPDGSPRPWSLPGRWPSWPWGSGGSP